MPISIAQYLTRGLLLMSSWGFTHLSLAQEPPLNPSAPAAAATVSTTGNAGAGSKGFLWEVKDKQNTLFIFGSIHAAKASFYPLQEAVEEAYRRADLLAVEVDVTDKEAMEKAMPSLTFRAPDKLENHLSKASWRTMNAVFGEGREQFQALRPGAVVSVVLMQTFAKQGYLPEFGLDKHFIERARNDKKPVLELESVAFQANVLGGLNDIDGEAWLMQTLAELRDGRAQEELAALVAAWQQGDEVALAKIIQASAGKDKISQKLTRLLFDERNVGMSKKITTLLNSSKKVLVVVGAGHFVGQNSILDILQKQGYQVRQIK